MGPAAIGLALTGIGTGASLIGQQQQRKSIKKANKEQRAQDAFQSLLSLTAGGGPVAPQPIRAAPGIDVGGAIGNIGSAVTGFANTKVAQNAAQQLRDFQQKQFAEKTRATSAAEGLKSRGLDIKQAFNEVIGAAAKTRAAAAGGKTTGNISQTKAADILFGVDEFGAPKFSIPEFLRERLETRDPLFVPPDGFDAAPALPPKPKRSDQSSLVKFFSSLFKDEQEPEDVLGLGF